MTVGAGVSVGVISSSLEEGEGVWIPASAGMTGEDVGMTVGAGVIASAVKFTIVELDVSTTSKLPVFPAIVCTIVSAASPRSAAK